MPTPAQRITDAIIESINFTGSGFNLANFILGNKHFQAQKGKITLVPFFMDATSFSLPHLGTPPSTYIAHTGTNQFFQNIIDIKNPGISDPIFIDTTIVGQGVVLFKTLINNQWESLGANISSSGTKIFLPVNYVSPIGDTSSIYITGAGIIGTNVSTQVTVNRISNLGVVTSVQADSWESSNPSVATVSQTGEVMGITDGITNITATYHGKTSNIFRIKISNAQPEGNPRFYNTLFTVPDSQITNRFSHLIYHIISTGETNLDVLDQTIVQYSDTAITSFVSAGNIDIILNNVSQLTVGDYIVIYFNYNGDEPIDIKTVSAINGNIVTLDTPLLYNHNELAPVKIFHSSFPDIQWISDKLNLATVENGFVIAHDAGIVKIKATTTSGTILISNELSIDTIYFFEFISIIPLGTKLAIGVELSRNTTDDPLSSANIYLKQGEMEFNFTSFVPSGSLQSIGLPIPISRQGLQTITMSYKSNIIIGRLVFTMETSDDNILWDTVLETDLNTISTTGEIKKFLRYFFEFYGDGKHTPILEELKITIK